MNNDIVIKFQDGSRRRVSPGEAQSLIEQLKAGLEQIDFLVGKNYVYRALDKQNMAHNTGSLWNIMTPSKDPPFSTFSHLGKPTKVVGSQNSHIWLSARNIMDNHDVLLQRFRRQFGPVNQRCFRILLDAIREDLNKSG